MDYIDHILHNDNNIDIMELTKPLIKEDKNSLFKKLNFTKEEKKLFNIKLKDYRYISNIDHFQYGRYIRWFNIDLKLENGGIICKMTAGDKGLILTVKNFKHQLFTCNVFYSEVFQKITSHEKILLEITTMLDDS
jgi:hypothetical protein